MQRLLTNHTKDDAAVSYGNVTQIIEPGKTRDLGEMFEAWELANSDTLLELLGQGADKYALNDGVQDLTTVQAIDLIRGYCGHAQDRIATALEGILEALKAKP
jgi:hypothetical protein